MTGKIFSMHNLYIFPSCRVGLGVLLLATASAVFPVVSYAQDSAPSETMEALPEDAPAPAEESATLPDMDGDALPDASTGEAATSEGEDPFALGEDGAEFEKSAEDLEADFRKKAFDSALDQLLPLNPDEIRSLLEKFDRTVESSNLPVHPYPRPESVVSNISLDPGSLPLVVRLAFGYVTTLSILDSSGSPWPIEDLSWVGDFDVMEDSAHDTTHLLRISPQSQFAHGNLSMRLVGLDVPVVITFETGRDMVHYRFDAVVPRVGPFAKTQLIDTGIQLTAGNEDLSTALAGVMPDGAESLTVSGVDGRTSAYIYNGLTYVRTPLTLLSPAWNGSVTSADGMRVYAMDETPVVLLSDKGRMVRAYLTAREEMSNE